MPPRPPPKVGTLPRLFDLDLLFDLAALRAGGFGAALRAAGAGGGGAIMGIPPPPCRLTAPPFLYAAFFVAIYFLPLVLKPPLGLEAILCRSFGPMSLAILVAWDEYLGEVVPSWTPRAIPKSFCCDLVVLCPLIVPMGLLGIALHAEDVSGLRSVTEINPALHIIEEDSVLAYAQTSDPSRT